MWGRYGKIELLVCLVIETRETDMEYREVSSESRQKGIARPQVYQKATASS